MGYDEINLLLLAYGSEILTVQLQTIFTYMYNHLKIYQDFDHGYIPRICNFKVMFIKKITEQYGLSFQLVYHIVYNTKDKSGKRYIITEWYKRVIWMC